MLITFPWPFGNVRRVSGSSRKRHWYEDSLYGQEPFSDRNTINGTQKKRNSSRRTVREKSLNDNHVNKILKRREIDVGG